ncbi:MAG TPA: protease complex subunit PrcB family protein [Candidatus Dorea gallistercoris]|uniref:Protease complex subunit PrcB family protein n=1 Tax=Candidatus Dorea gallistercoris TaxID=2838542 RepID=A0A9D1UE68_9FIRM|nr:protease complex subunit PrcB family protein [Candidatus Dorea gallistercoris]
MKYLQNWGVAFLAGCTLLLSACSIQMDDEEKLRDIEFTVVDQREIPEELGARIEKEKAEAFRFTFADEGWLYLARGYGRKDTGGYSVEVTECYESTNAVCLRTRLRGPSRDEEITEEATWPYIVVKMEYCDKHVIFQ